MTDERITQIKADIEFNGDPGYKADFAFLLAELDAAIEHARVTARDVLTLTGRKVALEAALDAARAREAKLREKAQAVLTAFDAGRWVGADGLSRAVSELAAALAGDIQGVADSSATTQDTVVDGIDLNAVVALYRGDRLAMAHALVQIRNAAGAIREQLKQRTA